MPKTSMQRVRQIVMFLVGLALVFGVAGCRLLRNEDQSALDEIRDDLVFDLAYPQSKILYRVENPEKDVPLEGVKFGAQVSVFYGSGSSDTEVEDFYKKELERLGWDFLGAASARLNTYRYLVYRKDPLSLQLQFWYREDFQRQLPSIDTEGVNTIYEVLLFRGQD